jgi:hypothetical protein
MGSQKSANQKIRVFYTTNWGILFYFELLFWFDFFLEFIAEILKKNLAFFWEI